MKVSIITVSFNDSLGLQRTLNSVRRQTCPDYELIVMDGGSTDDSLTIIQHNDDLVSFYESAPDGGPFFGMNKGVEHATNDYCIFMNAGDSFYDEHVLEKFMEQDRTKDIYTGVAAEHLGEQIYQWNPPYAIQLSLKFFYRGALSHQSSFIKTTLLKKHPYDTRYTIAADWKFFLETLLLHDATYEPLPFFVSHYMDGGISRDAQKAFAERDTIFNELFSRQQLQSMHRQLKWDELAQKVDPLSKIGRIISIFTSSVLKLRK